MTRPESIFFGMFVVLVGMLSTTIVFATGGVLAYNLINLARSPTEPDTKKRRDMIVPLVITIGVAAAVWTPLFGLNLWWTVAPLFVRLFLPRQLWF